MKLSKNLSLHEVTKSDTAMRKGIDNTPSEEHLENLKYLAKKVFQPIREHFGVPIYISSGYRSPELNKAVGGSSRSFHSHGMALDLDQDGRNKGVSNSDVFYFIKDNLPFTELIWEFGDENNPNWVHVAIASGREDEKNIKIAQKVNNQTIYSKWDKN
jgi:zinc D-Ala-D-Ala carboxypeptidase